MIHNFLINLTAWISQHPGLAGLAIFISSFAESLAFVGLFIPGAALMMTAGALIANGALSFWGTMLWAVCGAVLGDGISYWFGRYFKDNIRFLPLFNRHPEIFDRVELFFQRHGGKSVFFGRFIGPIRPIIPIVAGMLEMKPGPFTIYNVISALCWAPAYLLPGIAFGASLSLAGEVAGRLAVFFVIIVIISWLAFAVFQKIFFAVVAFYPGFEAGMINVIGRSALLQRWIGGLFTAENNKKESYRPLVRPLILFITLLSAALWLFGGITEDVLHGDPLVASGTSLYHLLQGLRTPWGDSIMVGVTMLGDAAVTVPLVTVIVLWLLWKKDRQGSLFLGIVTAGAFGLVTAIKNITRIPRPLDLYSGATHWSFPSSHATMTLVVFGAIALLCSRRLSGRRRWLPFGLAIFSTLMVGLSRLYLGAHWLSDVLAGYSLALFWLIAVSMAYLHRQRSAPPAGIAIFCVIASLIICCLHLGMGYSTNLVRYQPRSQGQVMESAFWLDNGWRQLAIYRQDMEGEKEQLLNLQYAGELDGISVSLQKYGWHKPVPLTFAATLRWLMAKPTINDLAILPQVHDGRHEQLLLIRKIPGQTADFWALRLWRAKVDLKDSGGIKAIAMRPLWLGSVTRMTLRQYGSLLTVPQTLSIVPVNRIIPQLSDLSYWRKEVNGREIVLLEDL